MQLASLAGDRRSNGSSFLPLLLLSVSFFLSGLLTHICSLADHVMMCTGLIFKPNPSLHDSTNPIQPLLFFRRSARWEGKHIKIIRMKWLLGNNSVALSPLHPLRRRGNHTHPLTPAGRTACSYIAIMCSRFEFHYGSKGWFAFWRKLRFLAESGGSTPTDRVSKATGEGWSPSLFARHYFWLMISWDVHINCWLFKHQCYDSNLNSRGKMQHF